MPYSRILPLQRRMDHVAGNQAVVAALADQNRVMIDGVAGRRNELNPFVEVEIALHDLRALGRDDRQHRVGDPRHACRVLLFALRPMLKLAVGHDVFGLGKGRHPAAVFKPRVPADVIGVQMRAHHIVDVVDGEAHTRKLLFEPVAVEHVPERPRRARLVIADAGIDQDIVVRRLDDEALDAKHELVGRIEKCGLQPGAVRRRRPPWSAPEKIPSRRTKRPAARQSDGW